VNSTSNHSTAVISLTPREDVLHPTSKPTGDSTHNRGTAASGPVPSAAAAANNTDKTTDSSAEQVPPGMQPDTGLGSAGGREAGPAIPGRTDPAIPNNGKGAWQHQQHQQQHQHQSQQQHLDTICNVTGVSHTSC
jgi:hypothetical protein